MYEKDTNAVIDWFKQLPLYIEVKDEWGNVLFHAVHACRSPPGIERMPRHLNDTDIVEAATSGTQVHDDIEVLLKGPEISLPKGVS